MSFGWSVGDLFQGAAIVWAIYESFGNRERSAKVEFAAFQTEFGLIKSALERLRDVAANCPGEDLSLGNEYAQTLERCASFIKRHQTLALENGTSSVKGKARRPSLQERVSSAWDKVSWPFEREEAERLRSQLERYVQIAIFKVTASTSDRTRKMAVDNLEILKAVKAMSVQVSTILRRCLPDGTPDDTALDSRYLARLQQRNLPTLLDPLPGLNSIPEDGVLSESDSQAALHRIKEITDRLGHLASRLDTIGRQPTPSPERRPLKRIQTSDSIGSDTTVGAPVVDLLNRIGDEVRDALNKVGYEYPVVPGQHKVSPHGSGPSSKALNDAAEDWEQFREWLQFQVVHSPEVQTGHDVPLLEPWQRHSPSPEPKYPPMTLFDPSPPNHSYLRACSPSRLPLSNDRGVEMSRTSSIDSNYPGSPLSIDSGWDRRSSIQSLPLTQHPVQVLFLDRKGAKHLHPPLRCQVVAHIKQRTNEPEVIEGTDTKNGFKITHCLYREHPSDREETSMIPYVSHSRHGQTFSKTPFCIRFMGSHRIQLERPGKEKKKWAISPIYVCQDKEDFDMFQNTLLGRRVIFRGDVTRIHSNTGDYCSLDTVRVIQDRLTNTTSILYFSTRKDSPRALSHFVDLPVSSLSTPKITGKNAVKIPLLAAQRDGFGLIPRRNSVESTMTSISQKSGNSIFSVASTAVSESEWKKEKWLQFDFENSQDAITFITELQGHP